MRLRLIFFVFIFLLVGCEQQEAKVAVGKVYPSSLYLQYFGEPPTVQQGYAYAHVGYLPLADRSGKVLPIPLFMYNENQQLDRILSQLFSDKLMVSERSKLLLPATQGVSLVQLDQAGDTLTVSLSPSAAGSAIDWAGIERAIVETATQFENVDRVRILYDNLPSKLQPVEGYRHRPEMIAEVPAPTLLDVVGFWAAGGKGPEEILVNFDRPVTISGFRLLNTAGEPVAGNYFTSLFDMAVVVQPSQPELFAEGVTLSVAWDVEDRLGRRSSQQLDSLPLIRREH